MICFAVIVPYIMSNPSSLLNMHKGCQRWQPDGLGVIYNNINALWLLSDCYLDEKIIKLMRIVTNARGVDIPFWD